LRSPAHKLTTHRKPMCVVELSNEPWGSLSSDVPSSGPFFVVSDREEKSPRIIHIG
jgi:hypothetical protein